MDRQRPPIVAGERTQLVGWYDLQRAIVHQITAAHSLDEPGKNRDYDEGVASVRWMVLHMLEETARHAGHLDAIRELLDGTKGYY
jgi:hypothetical protein